MNNNSVTDVQLQTPTRLVQAEALGRVLKHKI